jgi:hypothetical protein
LIGFLDFSFGYYGDDGRLFINDGYTGHEPTPDFGSRGIFGAQDTVGIGLNLETGEGFVTRNGKKLDVGKSECLYSVAFVSLEVLIRHR